MSWKSRLNRLVLAAVLAAAPAAAASDTEGPDAPVRRQLDAYNAHDLEAFVAQYHPDVEVYDYPGRLRFAGMKAFRERYARLFREHPAVRATVPDRFVIGNRVVDRELVTGRGRSDEPHELMVVYTIEAGLIRRVEFIRSEAPEAPGQ